MKLHHAQNNRALAGRDLAVVATPPVRANTATGLFRMLECAVSLSWEDLMPAAQSGLIHIEYPTGPSRSLEYRFRSGYYSGGLARMLDLVMQHQDTFLCTPDCHGLIQVYPPTEEERMAANTTMKEAFDHAGSALVELPAA